jgi:hypothetical protein
MRIVLTKTARALALLLLVAIFGVCTRGPTEPTLPDLTGTWTGMLGLPGSGNAVRVTWVLTHTNRAVNGPMTLIKPAVNVPATGTVVGAVNGTQLSLSYQVPAGTVAGVPECALSGGGTQNASATTITGTFTVMATNCERAGFPALDNQLSLTKQ